MLSVAAFFTQQLKYETPKIASSESHVWAEQSLHLTTWIYFSPFSFLQLLQWLPLSFGCGVFSIILVEEVNSVASVVVNTFTDKGMYIWL